MPSLRALRIALPQAHITLISLPWAKSFVEKFNYYLNGWLEFPGYDGIPEVPFSFSRLASFLLEVQTWDLVLQMHGNGSSMNLFIMELKAKQKAGFYPLGTFCPDSDRFLPYPEHEPEVWRHLRLLEFLGIPLQGDHLEFPIDELDEKELEVITSNFNLNRGNYICIHVGASEPSRRWPVQHFAAVADALVMQGWQVVLTGTTSERELTRSVSQMMQFQSFDLTGKTNLGTMAALLKNARLLICNDTGVSHLANALQVSSVVIFFNSDLQRWAPLDRERHRLVVGSVDHLPTPSEVLDVVFNQLQEELAYA